MLGDHVEVVVVQDVLHDLIEAVRAHQCPRLHYLIKNAVFNFLWLRLEVSEDLDEHVLIRELAPRAVGVDKRNLFNRGCLCSQCQVVLFLGLDCWLDKRLRRLDRR